MVKSIQNILIPINFSKSSEAAINTGISMCKRHGAALHLLHVKRKSILDYTSGKAPNTLEAALKEEVAHLDRLESKAKEIQQENNIDCFFHTCDGDFHHSVGTIADDFYCDLIILEKRCTPTLLDHLTGNSAFKVIKHAKCPVLTIPSEKKHLNFKRILLPLWPNNSGLDKLEIALPVIEKNKSKVILLAPGPSAHRRPDPAMRDFLNTTHHLTEVENVETEKELEVSQHSEHGILGTASAKKSDLIIIRASLTDGLRSLFTGNYMERLMNNSSVPVLSIKLA